MNRPLAIIHQRLPLLVRPKIGLLLLSLFIFGGIVFSAHCFVLNRFGSLPEGGDLQRIKASPNYVNGEFRNLEPTSLFPADENRWASTKEYFFGDKSARRPDHPLPIKGTNLKQLKKDEDLVVWLGHSSYFMQLAGHRILIDPVLSSYAAPLPFMNRAFDGDYPFTPESMPEIDDLVISHDHWDHLDYPTIMALKDRIGAIICPLGVGSHLRYWGIPREKIHEMDWNEKIPLTSDLTLYTLPARHFSGRGMFVRNQTLWASFAFETPHRKIYYSGDSGYGSHFATIGKRFGGFDLAILENGQYNKSWADIHMMPEETARAAEDLKAKALLPAHAGRFSISLHAWDAPYKALSEASAGKPYELLTPVMGEPVDLQEKAHAFHAWWKDSYEPERKAPSVSLLAKEAGAVR